MTDSEQTLRQLLEKEIGSIHFQLVYKMAKSAIEQSPSQHDSEEFSQHLKTIFPSFSHVDLMRYTTLFHTLVMLETNWGELSPRYQ